MGLFIPVTHFDSEDLCVFMCVCVLEDSLGSEIRITSVSNPGIFRQPLRDLV